MAPINRLTSFVLMASTSTCMAVAAAESRKLAIGDTHFTVEASGEAFSVDFKGNGDKVIATGEITIAIDAEGSVTTEVGSETYRVDHVSEGAPRRTQEVGLTGRRLQSTTEECEVECGLDTAEVCGVLTAMCAFDLFPPLVEATVCPALDSLCDQGGIRASCEATCESCDVDTPEILCGFNGGDPHILTLDGLAYDCHGRGEFLLTHVESTQGEVQVRFEPWSQNPSGPFTVTTAMVASEAGSSVVQVSMAASGSGLEILVDGELYDEAANPGTGVMLETTSSQVDMVFPSCMEITVSLANEMLSVAVDVPSPLETTGLLGNNNEDPEDDWTTIGGGSIEVPENPTEAEGTNYCTTNWCTTESTSIFTYVAGEKHGTYDFCDEAYVEPVWPDPVPKDITKACKGNKQCVFDFVFAGDAVGMATLEGLQECGGAVGDPHMTGFRGQKFDFTGDDGAWYCLVNDGPSVHLNMRVTAPVPAVPQITYITGLSVMTTDVQGVDHTIEITVSDPHNMDTSCPENVSPCLADGALTVKLDGQESLTSPGEVTLGPGVAIAAVNLPGPCRSFGFEKYWARKKLQSAGGGRKLDVISSMQDMGEWILSDPTATNKAECAEYVAAAYTTGLFEHESEHASVRIMTPIGTIRLSHGRLHQLAMRDPTDQFDLPEHLTWQMNVAVDHQISLEATGVLGETVVPVVDDGGKYVMTGMDAIRGSQEDYRVTGPLDTAFAQGRH